MEGHAAVAIVLQGVVRMAEIDVLDACFRAVMDAVQVAKCFDGHPPAMRRFPGQAMEPGGDRQIVEHVSHLAGFRRTTNVRGHSSAAGHGRMMRIAIQKDLPVRPSTDCHIDGAALGH